MICTQNISTILLLLRLCESIFHIGLVVILDSGFCILRAIIELRKRGPKIFEFLKIIRIKAIERHYYIQSRYSTYYIWMIYSWRPLHPDLPSYYSSHFLSQPEMSCWIPRSFTRNKFISKDLYIVRYPMIKKKSFFYNIQSAIFKKKKRLLTKIFLKNILFIIMQS